MNPEQTGYVVEPEEPGVIDSDLAREAAAVLLALVGKVVESPPGSNHGPFVDEIMRGVDKRCDYLVVPGRGYPWCARTQVYAFQTAAAKLGLMDPFRGAGDCASGIKMLRWARSTGRMRTDAKPGRVGVIRHSETTSHVLMCLKVLDAETILTCEGNTGDIGHVDGIWCKRRQLADVAAWIEVD